MTSLNIQNLVFIKNVSAWNSGGGIELDVIELRGGRVLAISDEVVVLYSDMGDLETGEV
jgi:hypothetical protein